MGLRTRLLLLVSLAAIPALLLALFVNLQSRREREDKVRKDAVRVVQLAAAAQARFVDTTREKLSGLSKMPEALGTNIRVFDAFFLNLRKFFPNYTDFGLIESNGLLVSSSAGRNGETNLAGRAHLQRAVQAKQFVIGEYEATNAASLPSLLFGQPVLATNGEVARVLYAAVDLKALDNVITNTRLPDGGVVTVLDRRGNVLACRPDREKWIGRSVVDWGLWPTILAKQEGASEANGLDGIGRLYAFTSIRDALDPGLFVTVGIPTALAYAETQHVLKLNLAMLGLVAICIWLVAWIYANHYVLRPIETLTTTTRQVAAGNLDARVGMQGPSGELKQLAEAFDALTANLQQERAETERSQNALRMSERRVRELNAELEDRVRKRTAQLEQAYEELEAFSYSVSHDLRAPLRPIHGYVEMLLHELGPKLEEESRRQLRSVSNAAKRMGALIDDLLSFSRMGRAELRQATVNMEQVVHESVAEIKPEFEGRTIRWEIAPLPDVIGDRAMLKQVWANLLSNAVKYTRGRDVAEIQIGCTENENEFEFRVQDNGAGFEMKYAHKLFGVFQRLHRVEEFEGTGIGLANVRRIILRHGGRVWAQGQVDMGATFYFALPRTPEQRSDQNFRMDTGEGAKI